MAGDKAPEMRVQTGGKVRPNTAQQNTPPTAEAQHKLFLLSSFKKKKKSEDESNLINPEVVLQFS